MSDTVQFKRKTRPSSASARSRTPPPQASSYVPSTLVQVRPESSSTSKLRSKRTWESAELGVSYSGTGEVAAGNEINHNLRSGTEGDIDGPSASSNAEASTSAVENDGSYKGMAGYTKHIAPPKEKAAKAMRTGPQRAPAHLRAITIVDYQPDVCKDYKETGFCGFGDTCKFMHDRGDYMAGWQLDKAYEKEKRLRKDKRTACDSDSDSDDDEEELPFACLICRNHFTDPIQTNCGHYFCLACAIKRNRKTPKCAACGNPTGGLFTKADKILEKMRKAKEEKEETQQEKKRERDVWEGVEIQQGGDDDDDDSE